MSNKIVVCDGDFFQYFVDDFAKYSEKLKVTKNVIFTPHRMEFSRIYKAAMNQELEDVNFIDKIIEDEGLDSNSEHIVKIDAFKLFP